MSEAGGGTRRSLRLVILDDNPFVRTPDGIRPRSATFHRFAEAVAELGPFDRVDYAIPVAELRPDERPPLLGTLDETRLRVIPTAPFRGAGGYLARLPHFWRHNRRVLEPVIRDADLLWIKAPASNALLAARLAHRHGVARFTYVAGSARQVVAGQRRGGVGGIAAALAARLYDAVTAWLVRTGPALLLDAELFTSVTDERDLGQTPLEAPLHPPGSAWTIAWAGRLAGEKGLGDLLEAVAGLRREGRPIELLLIGDGPHRARLGEWAVALGVDPAVTWTGLVADRARYMGLLREADLFVLPSRAEGVPKVLVEAMAAGLPVVAAASGTVPALLGHGTRGRLVEPGDVAALQRAIADTIDDPAGAAGRRADALAWAALHTRQAQAARLLGWLASEFPDLMGPGWEQPPDGQRILSRMPFSGELR